MLNEYVLIRGVNSGVFVGKLKALTGTKAELEDCIRVWYWEGAASLSELAMQGPNKPEKCKFPKPTKSHYILDVCEVIPVTALALERIKKVKPWSLSND